MRSSISDSKSQAVTYAKVLAGICAVLLMAIELSAIYLLKHDSATYARISHQNDEAVKMHPCGDGAPPCVLMVGNSLLLHGVELDRLREMTVPRMSIYPIFLEATGYYDWLYGLRRLFREGAKPQVVVVGVDHGPHRFDAGRHRIDDNVAEPWRLAISVTRVGFHRTHDATGCRAHQRLGGRHLLLQ